MIVFWLSLITFAHLSARLFCFAIVCEHLWHFLCPMGLRLHSIHLYVHFEESSGILQLGPYVVLKQVSYPIELHDVPWFTFQPKLVKLYEKVAVEVMEVV
eukprot:TRINITY_DN8270_c0_g1_i1.p1 TRINITY_DN8270_c0_g1~~TRINITY_DN8270_c0_g1_i1.p1  ORF type:complete len:100 (+),score=8.20 TRINITY_DN8270_c0_g1_i1:169-468(+)